MVDINKICQDLYNGDNYPGIWHGYDFWGKAADFHEHPFFVWELIQKVFPENMPLNIIETGRCTGQSTNLFSGIAQKTNGYLWSFDIADWNRQHIIKMNNKYGVLPQYYNYIVDSAFNMKKYTGDKKIQIAFLDSLHTYEQIKNETLIVEPLMDKTSIIFFHDTIWCFDSVSGWLKDYLKDKNVVFVKHKDTFKPQCEWCEKFNGVGRGHGRPTMQEDGRPNFQAEGEVNTSPHYNKLTSDFIKYEEKDINYYIENNYPYIYTQLNSCCGIGALICRK